MRAKEEEEAKLIYCRVRNFAVGHCAKSWRSFATAIDNPIIETNLQDGESIFASFDKKFSLSLCHECIDDTKREFALRNGDLKRTRKKEQMVFEVETTFWREKMGPELASETTDGQTLMTNPSAT